MIKYYFYFFPVFLLLLAISCNKKEDNNHQESDQKTGFSWHDGLKAGDIPDFPVKGLINGGEVNFQYINFEKWRGSNDNVINFSVKKPMQPCGFIEDFEGFVLENKGSAIAQGETLKSKFSDESKTYSAYYKTSSMKSSSPWNCALMIESISDKIVTGKIAIFFDDASKSWLAGKFEAVVCNN